MIYTIYNYRFWQQMNFTIIFILMYRYFYIGG